MKMYIIFRKDGFVFAKMECESVPHPFDAERVIVFPTNDCWEYPPEEYPQMWHLQVENSGRTHAWLDREAILEESMEFLKEWYPGHVITGRTIDEADGGFLYLTGCRVRKLVGDAEAVLKRSSADVVGGGAMVWQAKGKSRIDALCGHAHVESLEDESSVGTMFGESWIRTASGHASVAVMGNDARIRLMAGHASVLKMEDCSSIDTVQDDARIGTVMDGAKVGTGATKPWENDLELLTRRCTGTTQSCGVPKANLKLPKHMITDGILSA